jgi:hypothetical protein
MTSKRTNTNGTSSISQAMGSGHSSKVPKWKMKLAGNETLSQISNQQKKSNLSS